MQTKNSYEEIPAGVGAGNKDLTLHMMTNTNGARDGNVRGFFILVK
jgi:hypothetical protein